ncbi:hypothetical protein CB1_001113003 [Camelus ferus]|nr:hypothetical protein CB1_001113003 [Camelus ferus]
MPCKESAWAANIGRGRDAAVPTGGSEPMWTRPSPSREHHSCSRKGQRGSRPCGSSEGHSGLFEEDEETKVVGATPHDLDGDKAKLLLAESFPSSLCTTALRGAAWQAWVLRPYCAEFSGAVACYCPESRYLRPRALSSPLQAELPQVPLQSTAWPLRCTVVPSEQQQQELCWGRQGRERDAPARAPPAERCPAAPVPSTRGGRDTPTDRRVNAVDGCISVTGLFPNWEFSFPLSTTVNYAIMMLKFQK